MAWKQTYYQARPWRILIIFQLIEPLWKFVLKYPFYLLKFWKFLLNNLLNINVTRMFLFNYLGSYLWVDSLGMAPIFTCYLISADNFYFDISRSIFTFNSTQRTQLKIIKRFCPAVKICQTLFKKSCKNLTIYFHTAWFLKNYPLVKKWLQISEVNELILTCPYQSYSKVHIIFFFWKR